MGYSGDDVICFIETNTPAVIKLAVSNELPKLGKYFQSLGFNIS